MEVPKAKANYWFSKYNRVLHHYSVSIAAVVVVVVAAAVVVVTMVVLVALVAVVMARDVRGFISTCLL
jgi:hypothetical protein